MRSTPVGSCAALPQGASGTRNLKIVRPVRSPPAGSPEGRKQGASRAALPQGVAQHSRREPRGSKTKRPRRGSNSEPTDSKSGTLSIELRGQYPDYTRKPDYLTACYKNYRSPATAQTPSCSPGPTPPAPGDARTPTQYNPRPASK